MITNNSLFKLKEREDKSLKIAQDILMRMNGKIDILRDLQVEIDIRRGVASYDILLITRFDTMIDFEAYLKHPVHLAVSEQIADMLDTGISVCYESDTHNLFLDSSLV